MRSSHKYSPFWLLTILVAFGIGFFVLSENVSTWRVRYEFNENDFGKIPQEFQTDTLIIVNEMGFRNQLGSEFDTLRIHGIKRQELKINSTDKLTSSYLENLVTEKFPSDKYSIFRVDLQYEKKDFKMAIYLPLLVLFIWICFPFFLPKQHLKSQNTKLKS